MNMQNDSEKTALRIVCGVLALLLVAAAAVCAILLPREPEPVVLPDPETEEKLLAAKTRIAELEATVASNESQIESYQGLVASYETRIANLLDSSATENALVKELKLQLDNANLRITALREANTKAASEIETLKTTIAGYDIKALAEMESKVTSINSFIKLLTNDAPLRTVTETVTFDVTDAKTGEIKQQTAEITYQKPAFVSVYYQDLTTGYTFSFNADTVRYSASLIKAPYICTVLREISAFHERLFYFGRDGSPLFDSDGNPLFVGQHPNYNEDGTPIYLEGEEKYDLSRVWTFDKDKMTVAGSGTIKTQETGFQLTYRQLIEYAILYSDNIAFSEIRKEFGTSIYNQRAKTLGVKGYKNGFMQLSAADAGIWLADIDSFIRTDATVMEGETTYGQFLDDIMRHASMNYLIGSGVSPSPVAHKYGWDVDSFHDMAIVYDEHPYVLVIMTDLDEGTSMENNAAVKYIVSVAKELNKYHKSLYVLPEETKEES